MKNFLIRRYVGIGLSLCSFWTAKAALPQPPDSLLVATGPAAQALYDALKTVPILPNFKIVLGAFACMHDPEGTMDNGIPVTHNCYLMSEHEGGTTITPEDILVEGRRAHIIYDQITAPEHDLTPPHRPGMTGMTMTHEKRVGNMQCTHISNSDNPPRNDYQCTFYR